MSDLDAALRAVLRERAHDISELPPALLDMAGGRYPVGAAGRPHRRPAWSLLAAAACALLVLGVVAALATVKAGGPERPAGPATQRPTAPTTPASTLRLPTSLPPTAHAARQVALSSVALATLPGYAIHLFESLPGYRSVAVRADADRGLPAGCNGCESATVYVDVFDAGRFDASRYGVASWTPATVGGRPAHLGRMPWLGGPGHRVPTLAWQFAAGRWALVQGVTAYGGRTAVLATVAAAVRPDAGAPVEVPFRLTWVPGLPVTDLVDDRSEGYALAITLGHNDDTQYHDPQIDLTLAPDDPRTVAHTAAHRVTVDGVAGWYDRSQGVADVPVPGGTLELGITDTGALSGADRTMLDRVLAGLRILSGDQRVPVTRAIP